MVSYTSAPYLSAYQLYIIKIKLICLFSYFSYVHTIGRKILISVQLLQYCCQKFGGKQFKKVNTFTEMHPNCKYRWGVDNQPASVPSLLSKC